MTAEDREAIRRQAGAALAEILGLPIAHVTATPIVFDLPGFDSVAAVALLERLEGEFQVEVPAEAIVPEAFESLDALAELFARPLQAVERR